MSLSAIAILPASRRIGVTTGGGVGPRGPKGDKGDTGATGPTGPAGAGSVDISSVEDLAELKGLESNATRGIVLIRKPDLGVSPFYRSEFGDLTAPVDFSIIQPTDNGCRYFQWP